MKKIVINKVNGSIAVFYGLIHLVIAIYYLVLVGQSIWDTLNSGEEFKSAQLMYLSIIIFFLVLFGYVLVKVGKEHFKKQS
jgi:hypothetical protein